MLPSLKLEAWSKIQTDNLPPQARGLAKAYSYPPTVGQKRPQPNDLESEQAIGKLDQNADELGNLQSIVPQLKPYPTFVKCQSQVPAFNKSEYPQSQEPVHSVAMSTEAESHAKKSAEHPIHSSSRDGVFTQLSHSQTSHLKRQVREVRFKVSDDLHGPHSSHKAYDKEHGQNMLIDYVKRTIESAVDAEVNDIIKPTSSQEKRDDQQSNFIRAAIAGDLPKLRA